MKKLINLTGHDLVVYISKGVTKLIPADGAPPKVHIKRSVTEHVDGVPIKRQHLGKVVGLPERENGTYYIVSSVVYEATRRNDLLTPDEMIRDDVGKVLGCKSLSTWTNLQ